MLTCHILMNFSFRFARLLEERGWTQLEAAQKLQVSQALISRYLSGKRVPLPRTIMHIAVGLGVDVNELTGGETTGARGKKRDTKTMPSPFPSPTQLHTDAMVDLKRRWKKKPHERDSIRHLVAILFPGKSDAIVAWLES